MTLIVAGIGKSAIWLLADRRISYKGRPPKDDARKIVRLECTDGNAIIGYTGLGATALGSEPSDWVRNVLRGRAGPVEHSLSLLAKAMKVQFPKHVATLPGSNTVFHTFIIPAIVNQEMRLYAIELKLVDNRKAHLFKCARLISNQKGKSLAPPLITAGSGAAALVRRKDWERPILRMMQAYDDAKVSADAVADQFAKLNEEVALATKDKSVGNRCIVTWTNKKTGRYQAGGGQKNYTGRIKDTNASGIPTIANGTDVMAIAGLLTGAFQENLANGVAIENAIDIDLQLLNDRLSQLPSGPDEELR